MANLITLQYGKDFLGIATADTAKDSVITTLIATASQIVESHCNRTFAKATYTEYLDNEFTGYIRIKNAPITSITSLTFYPDTTIDVKDVSDFCFNDYGEISGKGYVYCFPTGVRSIKVVYVGGYETIPADVQAATAFVLSNLYNSIGRDNSVLTLKTLDISYQLREKESGILTPDIKALLSKYRRVSI